MNREKVIEGLKQHRDGRFHSCDNCPYVNVTNCQFKLYSDALALLKEQEAVRPKYVDGKRNHFIKCGKCNTDLMRGMKYCSYCGRAVKWDA